MYPAAMVNITNKCTLKCGHCFIYRDGNPSGRKDEMDTPTMLAALAGLRARHGIAVMLWMGGEPLLRPDALREGVKIFPRNTITTNGTVELIELPGANYVVSLDGPPEVNDAIRGKGVFDKVMKNISGVPADFASKILCQCVVTKRNEGRMEEIVELLRPSRFEGLTFSFYVPSARDDSDFTWGATGNRDRAVGKAMELKRKYPEFVLNKMRSLELMLSKNSKAVTDSCPSKKYVLPLYLDGDRFTRPYCCYGNDVDCDLCGAWVVFHIAAKLESGIDGLT